jgi:hypothetical protein
LDNLLDSFRKQQIYGEEHLCDGGHRTKCFGKGLYKLKSDARGKEIGLVKQDIERLKTNFSYWHAQNKNKDYATFKARYPAVYLHHFNDHSACVAHEEGGFCRYKNHPDKIAEAKQSGQLRDKALRAEMLKEVKAASARFGTDIMLKQMHHPFSSQKNESLNQQVARFAPKDKHFGSSLQLEDRVALVVIIDSIGKAIGIQAVLTQLGCPISPVTQEFLRKEDCNRRKRSEYYKKQDVKRRRIEGKLEAKKRFLAEEKQDKLNHVSYGAGYAVRNAINGPTRNDSSGGPQTTKKPCGSCGKFTHSRRSSKLCEHYKPRNNGNTPL